MSIKSADGVDVTNNTSGIGYINPIRYRGYYYDNETGFYYLQSRYYDPNTGRFINADGQLTTGSDLTGLNLFAYAGDIAFSTITGQSLLLDTVFQGNQTAYETGYIVSSIATAGMLNLAANSPGTCFIAGTLIAEENGNIPIETISVGDYVFAYNTDTGMTQLKEVVNTFVRESNELVHIEVNGEEITTTPTHPFWVPQKGWTQAVNLRAGDRLQLLNGEYVVIEQIQHEILEDPVTVYNFEVEGFHTYFITDSQILVHNANCGYKAPKGGGGVTDRIKVGNTQIEFDHGGRHMENTGLSVSQVNQAIANDVINRPATNGVASHGSINVGGINIFYDYYTRSKDVINVGTYYAK